MKVDRDILLGQIAIERGLITEAQLEECLQNRALSSQKADPLETISPGKVFRPLGIVLLSKDYVKEEELIGLIEEQNRRFRALEEYRKMVKVDLLLGELLIKYNKTTQLQINKCIEIQETMVTKGDSPIPRRKRYGRSGAVSRMEAWGSDPWSIWLGQPPWQDGLIVIKLPILPFGLWACLWIPSSSIRLHSLIVS